jgi:integrase
VTSISKRLRADGKPSWIARWRDPAGKQRSRAFRRRVDAERFLTGVESAKAAGSYIDPSAGRVTFGAQAARWRAGKVALKASTLRSYDSLLTAHVLPRWGTVPLNGIAHESVVAWVAALSSVISPSRTRQAANVLRQIIDSAVRGGRLARNPALGVELPRLRQADRRYLSHAEVEQLAAAAGPDGTLVRFLAYTGMRWSEVVALRWRRVDFGRGRVEVAEGAVESGSLHFDDPKSSRRRSVPVPRFLLDELVPGPPEVFVFEAPRGGPLRYSHFERRQWKPAVAAAGLGPLAIHELRHTAASLAISSGANVKAVQRMLGHASAAMTLDTYAGLFPDDLDDVAQRLHEAHVLISCAPTGAEIAAAQRPDL